MPYAQVQGKEARMNIVLISERGKPCFQHGYNLRDNLLENHAVKKFAILRQQPSSLPLSLPLPERKPEFKIKF
jgi:hypothetical protein|tara:strand:- start:6392 stop:6610 length:219 start_codon:yes stop_codon:yes gene_type:complete